MPLFADFIDWNGARDFVGELILLIGALVAGWVKVDQIRDRREQRSAMNKQNEVLNAQTEVIKDTQQKTAKVEALVNGASTASLAVIAGLSAKVAELQPTAANREAASQHKAALAAKIETDKTANAIAVGSTEQPAPAAKQPE